MTPFEQNHEGRLMAMHLVLMRLLADSAIDLDRLHRILTAGTSAQTVTAETPEQRAGNAAAAAATEELDSLFSAAKRCRRESPERPAP
ncbi:MAG: hypothetical protein HYY97_15980 [Rhodocyclales bacterium]|nr:hypothetical protein [Rhodocyclales bacterium]